MTGLLAFVRKEEEKKAANYRLRFSRQYHVRRARRRHMLGARIAQRRQVHPRKERLTTAEQDRRDRDMHLVERRFGDLIKWSFVFWVGAVGAIAMLARALR